MENDARSHQQAVDALLIARLQNLGFVSQFFAIQRFLENDQRYRQQALDELALGYRLDPNYSAWTLFTNQGKVLISYPAFPGPRGKYTIPPTTMAQLQREHKTLISDIIFDVNVHMAFSDINRTIMC